MYSPNMDVQIAIKHGRPQVMGGLVRPALQLSLLPFRVNLDKLLRPPESPKHLYLSPFWKKGTDEKDRDSIPHIVPSNKGKAGLHKIGDSFSLVGAPKNIQKQFSW